MSLKVLLDYLQMQTGLTIDHKERRFDPGALFQGPVPGDIFQNCRYLTAVLEEFNSHIFLLFLPDKRGPVRKREF